MQPAQFKGYQPFRLWFGTSSFSFSSKQTHANTLSKREGQRAESDRLAEPRADGAESDRLVEPRADGGSLLCPPGLCIQVLCQAGMAYSGEKSQGYLWTGACTI